MTGKVNDMMEDIKYKNAINARVWRKTKKKGANESRRGTSPPLTTPRQRAHIRGAITLLADAQLLERLATPHGSLLASSAVRYPDHRRFFTVYARHIWAH
jgi:hypothetical protein